MLRTTLGGGRVVTYVRIIPLAVSLLLLHIFKNRIQRISSDSGFFLVASDAQGRFTECRESKYRVRFGWIVKF